MGHSHLRVDLGLVRQGVHLAIDFGLQPVEELTRVAELLEHSVYELGSLRGDGREVRFVLRNPPLRTGAFGSVRLFWDGAPQPTAGAWAAGPDGTRRPLDALRRESPLLLPVGRRTRFGFPFAGPVAGVHRVRLELRSVAIPPTIWMEFSDRLQEEARP